MDFAVRTILSLGGLTVVLHLWIYRRSQSQESAVSSVLETQGEFSLDRFEPMARLLSEEDFLFLKAQPGFKSEIGKKFLRERRRIFRLYLRELATEFHRLHAYARSIVATLPAENSALVGILLRQQVRFWYEISALELRVSLGSLGAPVDARALVRAIGQMQAEISQLAAPTAA